MNAIEIKEYETLLEALRNLEEAVSGLEVNHTITSESNNRVIIDLSGVRFIACIKHHITASNIESTITEAQHLSNDFNCAPLIIVGYTTPSVMRNIEERGISVLDYAGNCHIRCQNLFLSVSGRQNTFIREKKRGALTESAVRLIYYFLEERDLVSAPIREISAATGFSVGMVKNTLDELSARKMVLNIGKKRTLTRYKELLNLWVERYNESVKPKLVLRRMAFRDYEIRSHWMNMNLPEGMCWGGDCGANILDGFLTPGTFEIYTDKSSSYLMATGMVRPDVDGEIIIYKKFWKNDSTTDTAPLLIVYADLMGTGDSRCIEAANRLIDKWDID